MRWLLAALATALLAAALPIAGKPWPVRAGFLPSAGATTAVGYLLTAYLLFARYRADGRARMLPLAATYLFAGLIIVVAGLTVVPRLLAFSAAQRGDWAATDVPVAWFWLLWHGGCSVGLLATFLPRAEHMPVFERRTRALIVVAGGVLGLAGACAVAVLADGRPLAAAIGAHNAPLLRQATGPELLALAMLALTLVCWRTRRPDDPVERWSVVMAAGTVVDVVLGVRTGVSYTAGWYLAWAGSLVAAYCVLLALIVEIGRLYARLAGANVALSRLAYRDALTGLYNRRALDEKLLEEVSRADRYGCSFALLMLDIDHFKAINDRHGHVAGDLALESVARTITARIRLSDWTARYGGEEFVVVLPETDLAGAAQLAERIREAVAATPLPLDEDPPQAMTVSIGVAAYPGSGASPRTLLTSADRALYAAKAAGRDRVCCDTVAHIAVVA